MTYNNTLLSIEKTSNSIHNEQATLSTTLIELQQLPKNVQADTTAEIEKTIDKLTKFKEVENILLEQFTKLITKMDTYSTAIENKNLDFNDIEPKKTTDEIESKLDNVLIDVTEEINKIQNLIDANSPQEKSPEQEVPETEMEPTVKPVKKKRRRFFN